MLNTIKTNYKLHSTMPCFTYISLSASLGDIRFAFISCS